jgi:hypothetical protein
MSSLVRQLGLPGIDLDLSALDTWVQQFPEKEVRQAVGEIAEQQERLSQLRQDLEERLTLFERLAHPMPDVRASAPPAAIQSSLRVPRSLVGSLQAETRNGRGGSVSVKRQAILQILGRDPRQKFTLAEITSNLGARGLMDTNDKRAEKALSVMLSSMIDKGEIHRPVRAHYKFGPDPRGSRNVDSMGVHTP